MPHKGQIPGKTKPSRMNASSQGGGLYSSCPDYLIRQALLLVASMGRARLPFLVLVLAEVILRNFCNLKSPPVSASLSRRAPFKVWSR